MASGSVIARASIGQFSAPRTCGVARVNHPRAARRDVHFRVYLGANLHITSQLFFADALNSEIFADHPDYSEFGQPDTTNTTDNIIGGEDDLTHYLLTTARMPDGAMLASKVIAIRGALDQATCQLGGGMP